MKPSEKAVQAALATIPMNDILYGDSSKPISIEEMKAALQAAYQVDFESEMSADKDVSPTGYRHQHD